MERIKKLRYLFLPLIIAVLIFFIPFFWLKPGEMDLGGDNSRLYFYDPIAYLVSQSLYSVSHSGLGGENLSYYGIPFFLLLALVKSLLQSPTLLISVFHGLNMSLGFVSCYLIVKELLKKEEEPRKERLTIEVASILAGLFYTLSPIPIGGWAYPLLPMNQVFLNPLLFFLLLRFFLTGAMRYIYLILLVAFFFSPNFSFIGAPTFFAFFPLAVLFLSLYAKGICGKPIPIVKSTVGLCLFILLQSFHLFPQIASILTPGSVANETVFGDFGKFEWGLKYFLGTASIIKVSNSLLTAPQFGKPEFYSSLYILFPLLFVLGFLWNKSRTYLLTALFFFITLFLVTANITGIGFKLYVLAFRLPGFSMFRVFYGQWAWTYLFYYSVLIGLAIATVLPRLKTIQKHLLVGFIAILFLTTSWPLISGKLTDTTHWQSKGIKSHVKMDPLYEEVLSYIRSLPVDGKIISFPLSGPGYQVLRGENDAAYEGPSTITYLAGRNEFNGFGEFGAFGPSLLVAAAEKNYEVMRDIFAVLNIKYIFYNEDPFIYTDNYPGLPYEHVRDFFPDTQEGYKAFIKELGVKEVKSFGWRYHLYELDNTNYVPHIYVPNHIAYWNDVIAGNPHIPLSLYTKDKRIALYDDSNIYRKHTSKFDDVLLKAGNTSIIYDFFKKKKLDKFVSPTVARKHASLIYPLVVLREQRDLSSLPTINDMYIDRSIYFAEKRINELYEFKEIPLLKNIGSITDLGSTWTEPKLWELARFKEYNSWEITLARYQKAVEKLVVQLETPNQSNYSTTINKVELKTYLVEHNNKLRTALRQESSMSVEDKKYLLSLIDRMFADIYSTLNLRLPDVGTTPYTLGGPVDDGTYEVYINTEDVKNLDIAVSVDGKILHQKPSSEEAWMRFEDIVVTNTPSLPVMLSIRNVPNLLAQTPWNTAEQTTVGIGKDSATLAIPYNYLTNTSGFLWDIPGWKGDSVYVISFDYHTGGQYFSMGIIEKGGTVASPYSNELYSETIKSSEWKKFNGAVLSSKDAASAVLQIVRAQDDYDRDQFGTKRIMIKNVSVQKVYDPKIIFKKVAPSKGRSLPEITFTQINPTRYRVDVRDAKDPYVLVLSQSFHPKWKLFRPQGENEAKTVRGMLSRFIGTLFERLVTTIISGADLSNSFLDANTFKTWGQDPIAEATHFPVNGYANSWYIEPKDVQNQTDYTLILEMTSQKLFYGSLFLSTGVFFFVLLMFAISLAGIRP